MDKNKFKCRYCGETRLKKTQGGGYACAYCGRQPETMMASSMVMNESYARGGTFRGRTFVAEKIGANKKEESITDLEHHLEENWLSYLQYFQKLLKANITSLQEKLNLDPKVIAITKKIWEIYLQKWVESKKRIVSFFSVPRKGLYRSEDPTFPKRKYDTAFEQIEEMSDFQDEEGDESQQMNFEPEVSKFNFDFIFSQLSEGINTNLQTQEQEMDIKLKKAKKEIKQTRREYYSARFWIKPKENLKAKRRRRKSTLDHLDGISERIEEENSAKKTKRLPKKLFAETSIDFLQNIHNRYLKVSKITINQIVEDYNQVLNYEKGDKKEKLRSLKRRSSYLKVDHLQNALSERNIDTETFKPCHHRQGFQKMAKELIFIHDYFCFVVYKHNELEPVTLNDVLHHVNKTIPFEETDEMKSKDDKQETIITLAKEFISKHLAKDQELVKQEEPKKASKLFPLEFNLIPLICFVALRVSYYPVFPKDMYEWIRCEIMPYFTVPDDCSTDGLKDYLIKPTNIPSPAWIRTSYKSFIRIYDIEIPQNVLFTKNIIERTFLDCGLPRKLEETCFRLCNLISLIRKDHQFKSIDEDLTLMAVILATLKLFYGFDDNFYGIFLNLVKANEISRATKDDKIRIGLFNLINAYEKLGEKDHVMNKMSEIPKFHTIINEWQDKISKGKFNIYFKYEEEKNQQIPWDYKDLKYLNKSNVLEYLNNVKEKFFSKDSDEQNEFRKLQEEFKELYFDEVQTTSYEYNDYLNPKVTTNATLFDHQASNKAKISTFFSQELEFVSKHQDLVNSKKESFEEEEEQVAMPLPCDNYFIYKKFQSIPNHKIKYEFLFLLNLFSAYLLEPLEDLHNALKFIDKHLIELCTLVDT